MATLAASVRHLAPPRSCPERGATRAAGSAAGAMRMRSPGSTTMLCASALSHCASIRMSIPTAKPEQRPLFSFGVIADVQWADTEDGSNYDKTVLRRYHAHAMHTPRTCHAHATHMPCARRRHAVRTPPCDVPRHAQVPRRVPNTRARRGLVEPAARAAHLYRAAWRHHRWSQRRPRSERQCAGGASMQNRALIPCTCRAHAMQMPCRCRTRAVHVPPRRRWRRCAARRARRSAS